MTFFSYDPEGDGLTFHKTADEARKAAEKALEGYRDEASDGGWEDSVTRVCWGEVRQKVKLTGCKTRPPAEELDECGYDKDETRWGDFDETHEYELRPELPASAAEPTNTAVGRRAEWGSPNTAAADSTVTTAITTAPLKEPESC